MAHSRAARRRITEPLFELKLDLKPTGSRESSKTLHRELTVAILDGRLAPGTRLPPTRKSMSIFGVSRNTAAEVYERLVTEAHAVTRRGAGTFVAHPQSPGSSTAAGTSPTPRRSTDADFKNRLNPFWLRPDIAAAMSFWRDSVEVSATRRGTAVDFRPAMVDSRLFPLDVFRRVSAQQLRGLERKPASFRSPQGNQGNFHLRKAITRHIAVTRAVPCQEDDVLVTAGAQQAFDLLARALITPNKTVVAMEDPGYPPMRVAFAAAGATLVPVGIDAEGLIIEQLPRDVGVICVTPSHQFPMGVTMSLRRREALLAFARDRGAVIVEDDYDGEFRYEGSPLPALRTQAAADVVFYVGTFSKCMMPALRLGFIVSPPWAIATLTAAKNCLDWHCPTPVQTAVASFIGEGHLTRHVRRMRDLYKDRRRLLLELLREKFSDCLTVIPSYYGMHVAAVSHATLDLEAVAESLAGQHVKIHTLSRYFLGVPTVSGFVFGYGTVDSSEIRRGMSALRRAL